MVSVRWLRRNWEFQSRGRRSSGYDERVFPSAGYSFTAFKLGDSESVLISFIGRSRDCHPAGFAEVVQVITHHTE